jgi:malate dehydrogenase (quinone)
LPVPPPPHQVDAVLIGGGIMSATLATMLHELEPDWRIVVLERLDRVGQESSDPWNNAGTGHAALCELNYTPARADGTVETVKAVGINESFQLSRQLWAHLVENGTITTPRDFINSVPHMSFVRGAKGVEYLRQRHLALGEQPLFAGMEFSDDHAQISEWAPLLTRGRRADEKIAATRSTAGTDVDFGSLTKILFAAATSRGTGSGSVELHTGHGVKDLTRRPDGSWDVVVEADGTRSYLTAPFVFIGSGGGALHLLQRSGIPEGRGFGGFPVSGQFLRTRRADLVAAHQAKVYGQAEVGAPPMSVPHLDARVIDGQRSLLFGPYAGFSPKFLKAGSVTDLPFSVKPDNLLPMLAVAKNNVPLTTYLVKQVVQSSDARLDALKVFFPDAEARDWELITAGQRVQVIKKGKGGGVLQFGTELVHAADGSVAALLGASPGASTAVGVMVELLQACFPAHHGGWLPKLREMIPSYGTALSSDVGLLERTRKHTDDVLQLQV